MALFNLEDILATQQPQLPERDGEFSAAALEHFEQVHGARVSTVKKHIPKPPSPGEMWFIWTTAQFNTMSLIIWLIENLGIIDELIVSTYSVSNICIETMLNWLDLGKIKHVHLYISDYVPRMSPKKYNLLQSAISARPGKVSMGLGFNHSKITLAAIGDNRIVITGSGNFAENSGNEQYTICNSETIYEFYKSCIKENHPVRYKADRRSDKTGRAPLEP